MARQKRDQLSAQVVQLQQQLAMLQQHRQQQRTKHIKLDSKLGRHQCACRSWKEMMAAHTATLSNTAATVLRAVEERSQDQSLAVMIAHNEQQTCMIFYSLVMLTYRASLQLVRQQQRDQNGLEAFRDTGKCSVLAERSAHSPSAQCRIASGLRPYGKEKGKGKGKDGKTPSHKRQKEAYLPHLDRREAP
eukprot:3811587-Amphidinium_carterae.1